MKIDRDDIALILSGVEILQDLEVEAINDIARLVKFAKFPGGKKLVERGQPGEYCYILFSGKVEVHLTSLGATKSKQITLRKGSVVGEISMLTGKPYSADVVAMRETVAMYLDREQFHQLIEKHKSFAESMSSLMSQRIAQNGEINRVGKYEVVGKLGEGAMAVVFAAYDKELEREVAIKMLKYELAYDPEFLQRFTREAKTIASLQHPNIVNVIEIISEFSTSFIVMEKLEGENLADVIEKQGAFSMAESQKILFQVANALQYAHNQGIVHRDIKPANIMMDTHGNVKLTDFGVSGPPQDKDVNIEGTPYFLAPEVISGKMVDGRADIYALGVTAFFLLSNKLPFTASTIQELHAKQLNDPIPDIKKYCAGITLDFISFLSGTLDSDPGLRLKDWEHIKSMLSPGGDSGDSALGYDEVELIIRMNQTSMEECQEVIKIVRKLLREKNIVHAIEMERGNIDISL